MLSTACVEQFKEYKSNIINNLELIEMNKQDKKFADRKQDKTDKVEQNEADRMSDRKNGSFVQYDESNLTIVRDLIKKNPVAADIFMFLSQHMNRQNAIVCPSKVLEEITGKARTTVSNAIKLLKDEHYVCTLKSGTTNVYVLNPSLVWKAWRTGKPYCEFDGKIFISKSENAEIEALLKKEYAPHIKKK